MRYRGFRSVASAALPAVLGLALSGCAAQSQGLAGQVSRAQLAAPQAEQHRALVAEGDALWEERIDRAKLEAALQKWEQAIELKDDDWETYAKLSRGIYLLADGWLAFEDDQERFLALHERGFAVAERGMAALSRDFEQRILTGADIEDAIMVLGREAVPLMYWYATNMGKWGNAKGFTTVLKYKDRIFKMISHVHELGSDYFYGASDRYFGAFYAVAPPFAGGDLDKSLEHFQESLKKSPDYLGTHVLIAEFLAPKRQDPDLFDRHLQLVLEAPVDIIPGLEAESAIEKKKAEKLLARKAELF
jgi:tetratricopeptide (TPR) repeat protein